MIKKRLLSMLVLLMTVVTGAWAAEEKLLTTIKATGTDTYSETTPGVVTVTHDNDWSYGEYGWIWKSKPGSVTVTAKEGYTITKCVFSQHSKTPVTVSTAPFGVSFIETPDPDFPEDKYFMYKGDYDFGMDGVSSIEVYGYAPVVNYTVKLAEGTEDANKWTISPNPAEEGSPVTATYKGDKKVKSVKAVKKPVAEGHALTSAKLGEIVCSDGKAYAAADKDNLPKGVKAEALVCYVDGEHGLALAMADVKNEKMSWDNERGANDGKTAAEWCDGWNTSHPIAGATWLLASQTQWNNMISAAGSASNLRNAFSAVGGTNLQDFSYWSSTPHLGGTAAYFYYFPSSAWQWTYLNQDYTGKYIRACLEW